MTTGTRQEHQIAEAPKGGDVLPGGIREAAKRLGIGERKAYRMAERGQYPFCRIAVRVCNVYIVPRAAFERFLRGEMTDTTPAGQSSGKPRKPAPDQAQEGR